VEEGPWLFRNWRIVIYPYDGFSKPSTLILDELPIWIQLHDIPEVYLKKKDIIQNLAGCIGKFVKIDTEGMGGGNFIRVRVEIDVNKPLVCFSSSIRKGTREVYLVKYEKVPKFCEVCGLIGHEYSECGNGFHEPEARFFGDWMIAELVCRGRGRGRAGGFAPCGGRGPAGPGFGHSSGVYTAWRDNDTYQEEPGDLPPRKDSEKMARKRLELVEDGKPLNQDANDLALALVGKEDAMMTEKEQAINLLESPMKIQDKKRMNTVEDGETIPHDISAGPHAGYCREQ
jgi:hypothetical protein